MNERTQDWDDERWKAERKRYLDRILDSPASKKVAVAGPGTGKTHTFREILSRKSSPRLALTFINNLVRDLDKELSGLAEVYSFYSFCKRLLYSLSLAGITGSVDYYPPLNRVFAADQALLIAPGFTWKDIDRALHNLDDSQGVAAAVLRSGDYYNAAGYTDSVYRVLIYLSKNLSEVPRYSQVVVDEYQDFSRMEVAFIEVLSRVNPTFVVGDDDQALYDFKHASAIYLRSLAVAEDWERFDLPFCTRCTEVMVAALHRVVQKARDKNLLDGRIGKEYMCFLPDKRTESNLYATIAHAACSVERNKAQYMAKYIHQKILEIPPDEIEESRLKKYPTALITGPPHFAERIFNYLSGYFESIDFGQPSDLDVRILDGYHRLRNNETSRLGWRIVLYCDLTPNAGDLLASALDSGEELADLLPNSYRKRHLENVEILRRLIEGQAVSEEDVLRIEEAVGIPFLALREELRITDSETEEETEALEDEEETQSETETGPTIKVTNLVNAKGLQAGHVFVVGMNGGHFPYVNASPTDKEVCEFLVALTRARKRCYLLSVGSFGNQRLNESVFLAWVSPYLEREEIDAAYFRVLAKKSRESEHSDERT